MKAFFLSIIAIFCSLRSYTNCEGFSKEIVEIIKTERFDDLSKFIIPVEKQIKIMHWPKDSASMAIAKSFNDSLALSIIKSAQQLRQMFIKNEFDINNAIYLSCSSSSGTLSRITIVINANNKIDSFIVDTRHWDKIYISSSFGYQTKWSLQKGNSFTIIEGQNYYIFKPRKEEEEKGKIILNKYLQDKKINYSGIFCTSGITDENNNDYLLFDIIPKNPSEAMRAMINLKNEETKLLITQ